MMRRFFISVMSFMAFALCGSAFAADPFTVTGVPVDATGATAIEAQTTAISEGQAVAAKILLKRLTLPHERTKNGLNILDADTIAKLIRALEIANEKRSARRYLGDITVAFNPAQVQALLQSKNVTMISTQARPRLVLPVMQGEPLWPANAWNYAVRQGAFAHSLTPLRPIAPGDANDNLIDASAASAANMDALKRTGQHFGVSQILIAEASGSAGNVRIRLKDVALDTGTRRDLGTVRGSSYSEAAAAMIEKLENDWKSASVSLAENAVDVTVSVLYRSHSDWQQLKDVINGSAQIQDARLDALSKDGALMTLTYGGNFDRLKNELAFKGVKISQDPKLGVVMSRSGRF